MCKVPGLSWVIRYDIFLSQKRLEKTQNGEQTEYMQSVCVHTCKDTGYFWSSWAWLKFRGAKHLWYCIPPLLCHSILPFTLIGWKQHAIQLETLWLAGSKEQKGPSVGECSWMSWEEPVSVVLPWGKKPWVMWSRWTDAVLCRISINGGSMKDSISCVLLQQVHL